MRSKKQQQVYKSPAWKLAAFFHASRDRWRARAKDYRNELRCLQVRVRDLETSRDRWRNKYFERQHAGSAPRKAAQTLASRPP